MSTLLLVGILLLLILISSCHLHHVLLQQPVKLSSWSSGNTQYFQKANIFLGGRKQFVSHIFCKIFPNIYYLELDGLPPRSNIFLIGHWVRIYRFYADLKMYLRREMIRQNFYWASDSGESMCQCLLRWECFKIELRLESSFEAFC